MKRYCAIVGGIVVFLLVLFLVVEVTGVPLLKDPSPLLGSGSTLTALLGIGLLVADVILPVPSSAVMVAHGELFGAEEGGFLLEDKPRRTGSPGGPSGRGVAAPAPLSCPYSPNLVCGKFCEVRYPLQYPR